MRVLAVVAALLVGGIAGASIQYWVSSHQRDVATDVYLGRLDEKTRENIDLMVKSAQLESRERRLRLAVESCSTSGERMELARLQ